MCQMWNAMAACQSHVSDQWEQILAPPSLQSVRLGGVEKSYASSLLLSLSPCAPLFPPPPPPPPLLLLLAHVVQSCSFLPGSTMERGALWAVCLLCWSCTVSVVTAIQRADLLPYGSLNGDLVLAEGDDETSKVLSLPRRLYFYDSPFSQLYVSTTSLTYSFPCYWPKHLKSSFQSAG